MSLANIKQKIEQDAQTEVQAILSSAKEEAAKLQQEAKKEIEASSTHYQKLITEEAPEILRRAQIVAKLDSNRLMLGAKQDLISQVFQKALQVMNNIDNDKYNTLVTSLMTQATSTGSEEIITGKNEKVINQAWIDNYNNQNSKNLTLSNETGNFQGGFILRNGKISENCTFETLVRWLKDDLESDVVKRLFGAQ